MKRDGVFMKSEEAWGIFLKTGAVSDYLNYSRLRRREGGKNDEDKNKRPRLEGNEHKG